MRHSRVFPPPKAPLGVSVSPTVSMQVENLGKVWIFNTFVRYKKPGSLCLFYSMSQPFPWTVLYFLPVPSPSPQTSALWPLFCPSFVGNLCCVSPVPLSSVCCNSGRGFCSPAVLSSSQGCKSGGGSSASPPRSDQLWSLIADSPMTSATFQGTVPEGTVLQRGSQLHAMATNARGFYISEIAKGNCSNKVRNRNGNLGNALNLGLGIRFFWSFCAFFIFCCGH